MLTKLFQELLLVFGTVAPSTLTLPQCFLPGATLAPISSAFKLVIIVAAGHCLFGLGLLMTEQAE